MITNELRNLLAKATTHAQRFQDGEDHTVAAALLTKSGKHVLGLNAHHFLGGPCGEVSALANHASSYPEDPIQAVVAVYGPTGQVIPPCGKCRQVLFDVDPSIRCIVLLRFPPCEPDLSTNGDDMLARYDGSATTTGTTGRTIRSSRTRLPVGPRCCGLSTRTIVFVVVRLPMGNVKMTESCSSPC